MMGETLCSSFRNIITSRLKQNMKFSVDVKGKSTSFKMFKMLLRPQSNLSATLDKVAGEVEKLHYRSSLFKMVHVGERSVTTSVFSVFQCFSCSLCT